VTGFQNVVKPAIRTEFPAEGGREEKGGNEETDRWMWDGANGAGGAFTTVSPDDRVVVR